MLVCSPGLNTTQPIAAMFTAPLGGMYMFQVTAQTIGQGISPLVLLHNTTEVCCKSVNLLYINCILLEQLLLLPIIVITIQQIEPIFFVFKYPKLIYLQLFTETFLKDVFSLSRCRKQISALQRAFVMPYAMPDSIFF